MGLTRRRAPRIAPASRLAFGSGDAGERALPGRGCAGALLHGGFGGDDVRRGATDHLCVAKAGDAVVAPKQEGAQGFYKVWVSDAPIEAE